MATSTHCEIASQLGWMRGRVATVRLPIAMHSTKTPTTMPKVNGEEPSASAPIRLSVVCRLIIAKPASSATSA